jgi:iron complex transport system substrate-binding protein
MGSFADAWELAGGTLVGASDDAFIDYGISSTGVEKVGDFSTLNLEAIIALEPDFVIMTGASTGRAGSASQLDLRDALVESNIPVAYFTVTTFTDYERVFNIFCQITGRSDLYQQNCADEAAEIATLRSEVPGGGAGDGGAGGAGGAADDATGAAAVAAPRVLVMATYSGGTRVQDSSTQTGAIFAELGATNLADENPSLLRDFSLEAIIEMDPDFIFVIPMGNDPDAAVKNLEEATAANPAWATLGAVQNGRYITLDPEHFLYKPNNRWAESYQIVFDYLYS